MTGLVGILTALWQVLSKAGLILQFGKMLWNAPKIYRFISRFGDVAKHLIEEKRLPNNQESVEFLRASAELIESEVVDFPGVDEIALGKVIEDLASEIEAKRAA